MSIVLDATTESLYAVCDAITTNQPIAIVSYADRSSTAYTPGNQITTFNGATAVKICDAPAAGVQRIVNNISIYNQDTTAKVITVSFYVSTTPYPLYKRIVADQDTLIFNGDSWSSPSLAPILRGYIDGLTLSNNGSDATNDIDIATGICRDSADADVLRLSSSITKRLDASWAVGTNQGGLDTGSIANAWYHVYLIKRPDTGVVDALFSTNATAPTLPSNYTLYRRIGSIYRTAGAIRAFTQKGNFFGWTTFAYDINGATQASPVSGAGTLTTLPVPLGISVNALIAILFTGTADDLYVPAINMSPVTASMQVLHVGSSPATMSSGEFLQWTNTSSQIRMFSSNGVGQVYATVNGWYDLRGEE